MVFYILLGVIQRAYFYKILVFYIFVNLYVLIKVGNNSSRNIS